VVVNDLDVFGAGGCPVGADAPLSVHSDAVGIGAIALQFLQLVSRRDPEITQRIGSVKNEGSLRKASRCVPWSSFLAGCRCQTRSVSLSLKDRSTDIKYNIMRYERQALCRHPCSFLG
jgi:hypothetical protein